MHELYGMPKKRHISNIYIRIVSENKAIYLKKLKLCLIQRGHPEEILNFLMSKLDSPAIKKQNDIIDDVTLYILSTLISNSIKILLAKVYLILMISP